MRIFIDVDSQRPIAAPGLFQEVQSFNFKRGATTTVEVQFTKGADVVELASDATGIFGIKQTDHYDDNYLTVAPAWIKTGTGSDTIYTFSLSFITDALNTLFLVDSNLTNDVPTLALMGEFQWSTGGKTYKSPTIVINVANDINRGGEAVPSMPLAVVYGLYLTQIAAIGGGTPGESPITHLDAVPTMSGVSRIVNFGAVIDIIIPVDGIRQRQTYEFSDESTHVFDSGDPGQKRPLDWSLAGVFAEGAGASMGGETIGSRINYSARGVNDGKPYYNLVDSATSTTLYAVIWNTSTTRWKILNGAGAIVYYSTDPVATPDLATGWVSGTAGTNPVPTVTAAPDNQGHWTRVG